MSGNSTVTSSSKDVRSIIHAEQGSQAAVLKMVSDRNGEWREKKKERE